MIRQPQQVTMATTTSTSPLLANNNSKNRPPPTLTLTQANLISSYQGSSQIQSQMGQQQQQPTVLSLVNKSTPPKPVIVAKRVNTIAQLSSISPISTTAGKPQIKTLSSVTVTPPNSNQQKVSRANPEIPIVYEKPVRKIKEN